MVTWVVFLAIGLVIGGLAGYYFGRLDDSGERKSVVLKHSLEETENNFQEYQQQVHQHFMKTGELVNAMTKTYQEVNNHLAESAKKLCAYSPSEATQERLSLSGLDTNALTQLQVVTDDAIEVDEKLGDDAQRSQGMVKAKESNDTHEASGESSTAERVMH